MAIQACCLRNRQYPQSAIVTGSMVRAALAITDRAALRMMAREGQLIEALVAPAMPVLAGQHTMAREGRHPAVRVDECRGRLVALHTTGREVLPTAVQAEYATQDPAGRAIPGPVETVAPAPQFASDQML